MLYTMTQTAASGRLQDAEFSLNQVISALYRDKDGYRVLIVTLGGHLESFAIDHASGAVIEAAMQQDGMVVSEDGYDDDKTATIWYLSGQNQYGRLLTTADRITLWQIHDHARANGRTRGRIINRHPERNRWGG